MPGLISAGTTAQLRRTFDALLAHTYDLTPMSSGGTDDGYGPTQTPGAVVAGRPCRYRAVQRLRLNNGDRVQVLTPTLTVPHDDPIKPDDEVSNVRDADGVLLLAGPLTVETVEASAGLGPTLQKRAVLRGGDAV